MSADRDYLELALAEAWKSAGHTRPNPPVGAVVVLDGKVVGVGRHRRCGGNHAEVAAMNNAIGNLRRSNAFQVGALPLKGATVYVTLEPCSRSGRVGACTDALIAAGVKRVVWAIPDPNPRNRGRARRVLARAGIQGELFRGRLQGPENGPFVMDERALIAPFSKHVTTGLPYVTVKLAMSLDGRICDDWGEARWISSPASRKLTGRIRERVDCVLVGAETIRRDDPSLLCHTRRNDDLWRAVVSRSGKLPPKSQVFTDAARARTLVYASPREALADLGRRGFMHVLCEGGLGLARSLAAEGLVDEWLTVLSPVVIGASPIASAVRYPGDDALLRF